MLWRTFYPFCDGHVDDLVTINGRTEFIFLFSARVAITHQHFEKKEKQKCVVDKKLCYKPIVHDNVAYLYFIYLRDKTSLTIFPYFRQRGLVKISQS